MIAQALQKLYDMTRKEPSIVIGGRNYGLLDEYQPVLEPRFETLRTHTLRGIVDMIEDHEIDKSELRIHVYSPTDIFLELKENGPFDQKQKLIHAQAYVTDFEFGKKYDTETFIISLNSQFIQTDDRDAILQLASMVTIETAGTVSDTGVSQKMDVKKGVSLKDRVEVKNPFALRPYRTFSEIEQPISDFVFRVHDDGGLKCSLHEADGAQWKLKAVESIREYFVMVVPDVTIIA